MKVTKTVQAGVVELTNQKHRELETEYQNLQRYLQGDEDVEVYSANKQQAERFYDTIKEDHEYPISVRKDLIDVQECESNIADYFVKVPTAQRYGGLKLPIKTHTEIKDNWEIGESKVIKRDGSFYINISVSYEVEPVSDFHGIYGVDLGLRNPVVGVALSVAEPCHKIQTVDFHAEQIQKIQSRYAYLRRNTSTGKKWKNREYNKVKDILHKVTTEIANYCKKHKLAVAVGNLKGIQNQDKGKAMNRQLHRFPHYKFKQLLRYKLKDRGLPLVEVDEAYTSQTCAKCGEKGERYRGRFRCSGTEIHSDVNGAWNIAKRALGKLEIKSLADAGATVT
ncbi:transposase [Methanonatronarchaeum sp. AMET-Sl]|uniref:RNA-guided endonuclease InsQ/TnpB family protein n=1 Tax=Methanonatronarchaeum sp. AMET-Sl TaxID=3037654 RepID=UPI00244D9BBB|nr:transposase [Methanonatronarchaeum sp. AMET-Sl]WGI16738.1 transposase [Methanonatronarchaeum sp. AMET-Sl]